MRAHLPALDGLRAVAIGLVLWQHAGLLFGGAGLDREHPFWQVSASGWWGVDLFLVLSGFLITRILLGQVDRPGGLWAFWRRRAARTFPLLYVYLAVAGAYGLGGGYPVLKQPWLSFLTHTTNLHIASHDFGLPLFGMLWSLGVEEQFYALWPVIVRRARARLAPVCLGLVLAAPIFRWTVYNLSDCYAAFHVLPFCRVDTLAMGAALALCEADERGWAAVARAARWALAPALLVLFAVTALVLGPWPLGAQEVWWVVAGYSLVGLSCAVIVAASATGGALARALLGNPTLAYLGRVSYGIYLWHCLLATMVLSLPLDLGVGARLLLWLGLVLAVASISFFGVERPWLVRRGAS